MLGWPALAPYRRTFGLLAFAYATLHLATWVGLEQFFDWRAMVEDVVERPWVTAGLAAWLAMAPLAATSTRGMARRLGRRWIRLHRLVYAAGVAAVVHHAWLVKADLRGPLVHAAILAALLAWRLARRGQS
jgi:sulfoxide reductase heme-binding subunit YedZ